MSELSKLASSIPAIMAEAVPHMRKMAQTVLDQDEEIQGLKNELRLSKIARRMEERRVDSSLDFDQKIAKLKEIDISRLDAVEQAVEMSAGGFKLGSLQETEASNGVEGAVPGTQNHDLLDTFILSGRALA